MIKLIHSIIFTIFGTINVVLIILVYKRDYDMMINHTFRIYKHMKVKVGNEENGLENYFFDGEKKVDHVKGVVRKVFHCLLIGDKGYYVINKFSGKMIFYKDYDLIPKRFKSGFDEIRS